MATNSTSEDAAVESLFAQALQLFPTSQSGVTDESPVLDTTSGLASRFRQICKDRFDEMDEIAQTRAVNSEMLGSWQLEQNTWDLVAEIYL